MNYALSAHDFEQVLDAVKNRLLDFVLRLDENWHIDDKPPSKADVSKLVSVVIYNGSERGSMAVFDQRGQTVNYQYNAAGNISLVGVQDKGDLAVVLEKLQGEVMRAREAKVIEQEAAVEAEYHLVQAAKETKKDNPNKANLLEHMGKAKILLEDVTAAAGLVTALLKAAEVAGHIFH